MHIKMFKSDISHEVRGSRGAHARIDHVVIYCVRRSGTLNALSQSVY